VQLTRITRGRKEAIDVREKERILVNADLYSPPAQGAPLPAVNANMRTLQQNIQRLKLDVAQHVPIHGTPGPNDQFMQIVGRQGN
jgi:hypothetical protein